MRLQKSNLKSSRLRLTLRPSDSIQFLQKKGHTGRWACYAHKKGLDSPHLLFN